MNPKINSMVNTQELRIGNFVFDKVSQKYVRVKCLGNATLTLNLEDGLRSVNDIEFVYITKEWLLNFGFKEIQNDTVINGYEYKRKIDSGDNNIFTRDSKYFSACGTYSWEKTGHLAVSTLCKGNYIGNNCEFVHELQNLRYSLVRIELPFNLVA